MVSWDQYLNNLGYAPASLPATFYDNNIQTDSTYEPGGVGAEKLFSQSEMVVGSGSAIGVMSGIDPTYRLWIGNPDPALANFSVDKNGNLRVNTLILNNGNVIINGAVNNGIILKNTIPISFYNHTNTSVAFAGQIYTDASDNFVIDSGLFGTGVIKVLGQFDMNDNNINNINTLNFFGAGSIHYNGGISRLVISSGGNQIRIADDLDGNSTASLNAWHNIFCNDVNGHNSNFSGSKSAIVPSSKGMIKVFSGEAPEAWFFDFAKDKEHIDPLFLEITQGKIHTIKTEEGELLVFRKRKTTKKFKQQRFPIFEEE